MRERKLMTPGEAAALAQQNRERARQESLELLKRHCPAPLELAAFWRARAAWFDDPAEAFMYLATAIVIERLNAEKPNG